MIKKAKGFATGSRIKIDISGVANGIYLIRAIDKQTLITQKVLSIDSFSLF